MVADLAVDLGVVAAEEEAEEEEEVDLVAEVVAEDLEVRRGKYCCSKGVCSKINLKLFLGLWYGTATELLM